MNTDAHVVHGLIRLSKASSGMNATERQCYLRMLLRQHLPAELFAAMVAAVVSPRTALVTLRNLSLRTRPKGRKS
jgi:hypothetical protein